MEKANTSNKEADQLTLSAMKKPFNYTEWQQTLFEEMSLEELSKKVMECYENKKNKSYRSQK